MFFYIKFIAYDHSTITKEGLLNARKFFYFLASFPRSFENIFIRRHLISLFFFYKYVFDIESDITLSCEFIIAY